MMKTNYIGHDSAYKRLKADGKTGWDDDEQTKKFTSTLERTLQIENVPKSGKFLELGCGAGEITLWFSEKGYDASGVDISPTAIDWAGEKAKTNNQKANFQVGNVLGLHNYSNDHFDIVLDGHCFHCIIGDDRKDFLKSAYRVLKSGGIFIIETMCGEVGNEKVKKNFDPESRCIVYNDIATRYIGLSGDILEEIKNAGFQILSWERASDREFKPDQDDLLVVAIKQ